MALPQRGPTAVIHHSDQNNAFASAAGRPGCRAAIHGRGGDAYDNPMYAGSATLKCELLNRSHFAKHDDA